MTRATLRPAQIGDVAMKESEHASPASEGQSDEDLLRQMAGGEHAALQDLHRRYAPLIFNLAAQSLDRPAAEEIVQDVFVALWRHAGTFDPEKGSARGWILRIAHLRVLNELRRRSRRPRAIPDPEGLQLGALADAGPDPSEVVWQDYRRATLRAAVNRLPPAQRQALSLAYFEDLTHEQIANYLQVPLGTVKTRIRAGVQKLRGALLLALLLAIVVIGGILAAVEARLQRQQSRIDQDSRALQAVTSSDVVPLRLTAAPGAPAATHATYRSRPGGDLAVITFEHFPQAPSGQIYQFWLRRGGVWLPLATVTPGQDGSALVVVEGHGVGPAAEALEVTREPSGGSDTPHGPVIVAWSP
ncbi:MAG TPA: sigma-70 family RNA polymerase sigma factor [Thermomicrobiaceae bacterium]|nr:sigma-70 family RNA polymerase sigma factor [Thermomicrobiaceae bacterium]